MERPGMRRGEATSALASSDSTCWSNHACTLCTATLLPITKESTGTGRAASTSRSKRATLKTVCALHALLTCASTWAIINLNKGHRLRCRAHRPSWSGGRAKRKARFNGNRAGGSTKASFFLQQGFSCNWLSLTVSLEQDQGVRYCSLRQTIDNHGDRAKTRHILQTTIESLNSNAVGFC